MRIERSAEVNKPVTWAQLLMLIAACEVLVVVVWFVAKWTA